MNIAETCGGIGVSLMVFRTQFEIETDRIIEFLDTEVDGQLAKYAGACDRLQKFNSAELRKRASTEEAAEYGALVGSVSTELKKLSDGLEQLNQLFDRRRA